MKQFMKLLEIEFKLGLRCPDVIVFGIVMPVGIFFLIAVTGGNQVAQGGGITYLQSAFAALMCVGICANAFMSIPLTISDYRDKKVLKHFFVTPVSPIVLLAAQLVKTAIIATLSAILVVLSAVFFYQYEMPGNPLLFVGAYLLVMVSMFSLGLMIASVAKSIKVANVVASCVYFPMLFLSGATIPFEIFPTIVQKLGNVLPLTYGIRLLKDVSLGIYNQDMYLSISLLVGFSIVGIVVSVVSFKWS